MKEILNSLINSLIFIGFVEFFIIALFSTFDQAYKRASSRLLKKEFPQIRQKLWKEYFWSQSFCLLTTGGAPIDVIKKIQKVRVKNIEQVV